MLDIEARLARQAVAIAVNKALEDVKADVRRGVRNLVDLGLLFSRSENQKWFFGTARQVVENPKNPYGALVGRLMRDVSPEAIRRVGLNLGYNSLVYGAKKLRVRQEALGVSIPWALSVDYPSGGGGEERLACCLREGQEMGIYSYALNISGADGLPALADVLEENADCFFALRLPGEAVDARAAAALARVRNAAVVVDLPEDGALRRLRDEGCLYGVRVPYGDADVGRVTSPQFLRWEIGEGCLFGAYQAAQGASQRAREAVGAFVRRARGEHGQPLVALDWPRDILETGRRMGVGGLMDVNLTEKAFALYRDVANPAGALAELFRRGQGCPT